MSTDDNPTLTDAALTVRREKDAETAKQPPPDALSAPKTEAALETHGADSAPNLST